mgnify:CR=1 FL=1
MLSPSLSSSPPLADPVAHTDTTRAPRPGEERGVSYHYVTRDDFLDLVRRDGFIEHAEFSGNLYGTSVQAVEDVKKGGKMCILDIDTQVRVCVGAVYTGRGGFPSRRALTPLSAFLSRTPSLRRHRAPTPPPTPQGVKLIKANHPHLDPLYVFISPPSLSSLKARLTGRGTESESSLAARLGAAVGELEYAKSGAFDVVVVNDELERAYDVLRRVVVDREVGAGDRLPDFAAEQ